MAVETAEVWDAIFEANEEEIQFNTPLDVLMHFRQGKGKRTRALEIINHELTRLYYEPHYRTWNFLPPQEAKSSLHRAAAAWILKKDPSKDIIYITYGNQLAEKAGLEIRQMCESIGVELSNEQATKTFFQTKAGGYVMVFSVQSGVAGNAADYIFMDDVVKGQDELTESARMKLKEQYSQQWTSRLAPGGGMAGTMTRWNEDDLAGWLMRVDGIWSEQNPLGWHVNNIPAQWDSDEPDLLLGRKKGEFLDSAQGRTQEDWEIRKRGAGSNWESLYQGNPFPKDGNTFRLDWFNRFSVLPPKDYAAVKWITSWDLAFTTKVRSDWTVGSLLAFYEGDIYVVDICRGKWTPQQVTKQMQLFIEKHPQAVAHVVETPNGGRHIIDDLKAQGVEGVVGEYPNGSKQQRANRAALRIENGSLKIPDNSFNADWVDELLREFVAFPAGRHDDIVDSIVQGILYLTRSHKKKRRAPGPRVRGV